MTQTLDIAERALLSKFENCEFSSEEFDHKLMLRLTWILLKKHGLKKGTQKNCELKRNFYDKVISNGNYNDTLTVAYSEILFFFMERSSNRNDFDKLLLEYPRLKYNFKKLVITHYGYNILKESKKEEPQEKRPILFTF